MDGIWGGSPLSKGESSLKEIAVGMWLPIGIQKSVQVVWCMGGVYDLRTNTKPYFLTSLLKQDVWQAPAIPDSTSIEETVGLKLSFGWNFKGDKVEISSHTILVITAYLPTWMV